MDPCFLDFRCTNHSTKPCKKHTVFSNGFHGVKSQFHRAKVIRDSMNPLGCPAHMIVIPKIMFLSAASFSANILIRFKS